MCRKASLKRNLTRYCQNPNLEQHNMGGKTIWCDKTNHNSLGLVNFYFPIQFCMIHTSKVCLAEKTALLAMDAFRLQTKTAIMKRTTKMES
jgi:hypothetical protein